MKKHIQTNWPLAKLIWMDAANADVARAGTKARGAV